MARHFTPVERGLIGTAAALVFTRVFAFSLTTLGFTEYARGLLPGAPAEAAALWAGIAFGAYGITMAIAQLGTGILSDRIGRRPVMIAGTALFVLGALVCVFATDVRLLVAGRLLAGLGGVSSAALAAVGETVPAERRTTAMALVGIPAGVAVFLGFALGPLVAGAFGFTSLFWITGLLGLVPLLGLRRPLPTPQLGLAVARRSLGVPVMALALAGFTANFAMSAVMFDFHSGVLVRIGMPALAVMLLAAFAVMAVIARGVDRLGGRAPAVAIGVAIAIVALAAPILRTDARFLVALAAGCLFFAAHASLSAILPSQVSRLAGRSGGTGHGIQLVVTYLGSAAGAIVAGIAAPRLAGAFEVLAAVAAAAFALLLLSLRPHREVEVAAA